MKKASTLIITALTALSLFIMAPAALAGNGNGVGDGTGPVCSLFEGVPVEISGIVTSIGTSGSGIGIDNGVEIVTVYGLGPVFFWDAEGIARPEIGEEITVNGYEIVLSDGTLKIIAASVIIEGEELVLRDPETGAPLWRGPKGKVNGSGNNGSLGNNGPGKETGNEGFGPKKGSGGCNLSSAIDQTGISLSADQTRTRGQKKDGSCLNPVTDDTEGAIILAKGGHRNGGGHGPGDGTGNGGNGPKDGTGNGNKSGTCTNA